MNLGEDGGDKRGKNQDIILKTQLVCKVAINLNVFGSFMKN